MNIRLLDSLIEVYEKKAQTTHPRATPHFKQLAEETAMFLRELRSREIPVEGVIS
jgi:quinol monooxygenase YgiN